jgi:hypothetical protein
MGFANHLPINQLAGVYSTHIENADALIIQQYQTTFCEIYLMIRHGQDLISQLNQA